MSLEGGGKTFARKHFDRVRDAAAPPASPDAEGEERELPAMDTLLHDKEFAQMLDSKADGAIDESFARIKSGKTSDTDMQRMIGLRKEFIERKDKLEALDKTMEGYFDDLKGHSKDFKDLCDTFKSENVQQTLKQAMREMAFHDPKEFKKFEARFKKLSDTEKILDDPNNPMNKTIADFAKQKGIDQTQLFDALGKASAPERTEEIRKLMRDQMGFFDKAFDSLKKVRGKHSSLDEARGMGTVRDTLDEAYKKLDKELRGTGSLLTGFVMKGDNNEVRDALMRAVHGQRPAFDKGIESQTSYREAQTDTLNLDQINRTWGLYLRDQGIPAGNFAAMPDDAQDQVRDEFWKGYVDNHIGNRGGFWTIVLRVLLGNKHKEDEDIKNILK